MTYGMYWDRVQEGLTSVNLNDERTPDKNKYMMVVYQAFWCSRSADEVTHLIEGRRTTITVLEPTKTEVTPIKPALPTKVRLGENYELPNGRKSKSDLVRLDGTSMEMKPEEQTNSEETTAETLRAKIKALRKANGLTQAFVAELLKLSQSQVSYIENKCKDVQALEVVLKHLT